LKKFANLDKAQISIYKNIFLLLMCKYLHAMLGVNTAVEDVDGQSNIPPISLLLKRAPCIALLPSVGDNGTPVVSLVYDCTPVKCQAEHL